MMKGVSHLAIQLYIVAITPKLSPGPMMVAGRKAHVDILDEFARRTIGSTAALEAP